jgi:hypothetical protein
VLSSGCVGSCKQTGLGYLTRESNQEYVRLCGKPKTCEAGFLGYRGGNCNCGDRDCET